MHWLSRDSNRLKATHWMSDLVFYQRENLNNRTDGSFYALDVLQKGF